MSLMKPQLTATWMFPPCLQGTCRLWGHSHRRTWGPSEGALCSLCQSSSADSCSPDGQVSQRKGGPAGQASWAETQTPASSLHSPCQLAAHSPHPVVTLPLGLCTCQRLPGIPPFCPSFSHFLFLAWLKPHNL